MAKASFLPATRRGSAIVAVIAVLALQGLVYLLFGSTLLRGPAKPGALASLASHTVATESVADGTLYEALWSGPSSPRGNAARDVPPAKALELAAGMLQGPAGTRDTEEGAFWLKRHLARTLGDEHTLRALTQLGSAYAEPTGQAPSYEKARQVWEVASAVGDPVAMCFLGALYENGLGVKASRTKALQWFERAKQSGGCPSVDEAISRVRQ
jgi:hypothetical protein